MKQADKDLILEQLPKYKKSVGGYAIHRDGVDAFCAVGAIADICCEGTWVYISEDFLPPSKSKRGGWQFRGDQVSGGPFQIRDAVAEVLGIPPWRTVAGSEFKCISNLTLLSDTTEGWQPVLDWIEELPVDD